MADSKWSSIAAVVAVVYSSYIEQNKVTQEFMILSGFMCFLAYIIVKRIDGTNIFSSTGTTRKILKHNYVCVFVKKFIVQTAVHCQ